MFNLFQGVSQQKEEDKCTITFEKFVMYTCKSSRIPIIVIEKIVRGGTECLDHFIFDMFDLSLNNEVNKNDLAQMLINLPLDGIIVETPLNSGKTLGAMSTDILSNLNFDLSSS
jgi:hypothetical protein